MSRRKQVKFKEVDKSAIVIQHTDSDAKKQLREFVSGSKGDLVLELACGRGEYTIGLASLYPDKKFIGIDIQGERLWYGMNQAVELELENVRFLRIGIEDLGKYFGKAVVNEIWITFPDPFPKDRHEKKRLTSIGFLEKYRKILKPGGILHLKTDDKALFEFSMEQVKLAKGKILEKVVDVKADLAEGDNGWNPELAIQTNFEEKHRANGKKIYYLRFGL